MMNAPTRNFNDSRLTWNAQILGRRDSIHACAEANSLHLKILARKFHSASCEGKAVGKQITTIRKADLDAQSRLAEGVMYAKDCTGLHSLYLGTRKRKETVDFNRSIQTRCWSLAGTEASYSTITRIGPDKRTARQDAISLLAQMYRRKTRLVEMEFPSSPRGTLLRNSRDKLACVHLAMRHRTTPASNRTTTS